MRASGGAPRGGGRSHGVASGGGRPHSHPRRVRRAATRGVAAQGALGAVLADAFVHVAGWAVSAPLATEKLYDLTGSVAFLATAASSLPASGLSATARQLALTGAICCWTLRLGTFLVYRVTRDGEDRRFRGVREQPLKLGVYFFVSAVWVAVTRWVESLGRWWFGVVLSSCTSV